MASLTLEERRLRKEKSQAGNSFIEAQLEAFEPAVIDDELIAKCIVVSLGESAPSDAVIRKEVYRLEYEQVEYLKFSYRQIIRIDNLQGFTNLRKLQLDNNRIKKIEGLDQLVSLEWLDLSFNKIEKIEGLDNLTKLTDLSLAHNQIAVLENMDHLVNLTALSLGNNKIASIANVMYLRKFKKLAVLNLRGNPMEHEPNYKSYVMAHVRSLRYLDYQRVDEAMLTQASETYQDELLGLKDQENQAEAEHQQQKSREQELGALKQANLESLDTLFEDILREDVEFPKLAVRPRIVEPLEEYRTAFKRILEEFRTVMLSQHAARVREESQFRNACEEEMRKSDERCLALLRAFDKKLKPLVRGTQTTVDQAALMQENANLRYVLLDAEVQLVEVLEEHIREFERRMADLTSTSLEVIQAHFQKLRELEAEFHQQIMANAMLEYEKFQRGELGELMEEARQLLSDHETLMAIVNGSHETQSYKIEMKDEEITKSETRRLDETLNKVKKDETTRNRNRVAEIALKCAHNEGLIRAAWRPDV